MKQWTSEQQKRFRELCTELAELTRDNDELWLLIAFVRMFYHVKEEEEALLEAKRREREKLEAKLNGDTDTNKLYIVK